MTTIDTYSPEPPLFLSSVRLPPLRRTPLMVPSSVGARCSRAALEKIDRCVIEGLDAIGREGRERAGERWRRRALVFLDLDDTLIPTQWMKPRLSGLRDGSLKVSDFVGTEADRRWSELGEREGDSFQAVADGDRNCRSYKDIRPLLNVLSASHFEEEICELMRAVHKYANGRAYIITNARSFTWLALVRSLFPRLHDLLDRSKIPIIKTTPGVDPLSNACTREPEPEPRMTSNASAYFDFWMRAKYHEFHKIIDRHLQDAAPVPSSGEHLPARLKPEERDRGRERGGEGREERLELCNIGDTDFEHVAFKEATKELSAPVSIARNLKCTQGLDPWNFVRQLRAIRRMLESWTPADDELSEDEGDDGQGADRDGGAALEKTPSTVCCVEPVSLSDTPNPKETVIKISDTLILETWTPEGRKVPSRRLTHADTRTCSAMQFPGPSEEENDSTHETIVSVEIGKGSESSSKVTDHNEVPAHEESQPPCQPTLNEGVEDCNVLEGSSATERKEKTRRKAGSPQSDVNNLDIEDVADVADVADALQEQRSHSQSSCLSSYPCHDCCGQRSGCRRLMGGEIAMTSERDQAEILNSSKSSESLQSSRSSEASKSRQNARPRVTNAKEAWTEAQNPRRRLLLRVLRHIKRV